MAEVAVEYLVRAARLAEEQSLSGEEEVVLFVRGPQDYLNVEIDLPRKTITFTVWDHDSEEFEIFQTPNDHPELDKRLGFPSAKDRAREETI